MSLEKEAEEVKVTKKIEVTYNSNMNNEPVYSDDVVEDNGPPPDDTFDDEDLFDEGITTRNNYKSKISYYEEVNKPIMAIFFNFFN